MARLFQELDTYGKKRLVISLKFVCLNEKENPASGLHMHEHKEIWGPAIIASRTAGAEVVADADELGLCCEHASLAAVCSQFSKFTFNE